MHGYVKMILPSTVVYFWQDVPNRGRFIPNRSPRTRRKPRLWLLKIRSWMRVETLDSMLRLFWSDPAQPSSNQVAKTIAAGSCIGHPILSNLFTWLFVAGVAEIKLAILMGH